MMRQAMPIELAADLAARVPPGHEGMYDDENASAAWISCLCFDPEGRSVLVGFREHVAAVLAYDLASRRLRAEYPLRVRYGEPEVRDRRDGASAGFGGQTVMRCAFSPDGRWLAVHHASPNNGNVFDCNLQVFDRSTGAQVLAIGPRDADGDGMALGVSAFCFRPDGGALAAASFDGRLEVWELSGKRRARGIEDATSVDGLPVLSLAFVGARRLASIRAGTLDVRDLDAPGALVQRVDLGIGAEDFHPASIHVVGPDRVLVPLQSRDSAEVAIVDLVEGFARRIEVAAQGAFETAWVAPDGASILWVFGDPLSDPGSDLSLRRLRLPAGTLCEVARRAGGAAREGATALTVSSDGTRVARAAGTRIALTRLGRRDGQSARSTLRRATPS